MTSRIFTFLVLGVITLGVMLGFTNSNDNPAGSKSNTTSTESPIVTPPSINAAYYTDNFDGANDTVALKSRGYKVWYRGGGAQGLGATWFQGNDAVFAAYNGPTTGYVACNFQVVSGTNNIDSWLVLPGLNVGAGDTLSFWSRSTDPGTTIYPDSFRVMYSAVGDSTPEAASWVNLGRYMAPNGPWVKKTYLAPTAGANARFAIRYNVVNGGPSGVNSDFAGIDALNVSAGGAPTPCDYTWSTQTSGTTALIHSVKTVSNLIGWAGGVGAVVRKTTNGGVTWENGNPNPGVITGDIYNIYAWSANDAICTTSPGATFIYKTSNGGTTWTQVYTLAGGFINGLQMISATEGYGEGDPVGGKWTIVKTTDGGNTWNRMATEPTQVGSEAGWNNSFYITGSNIWFGTSATKVYHSTDLGVTWTSGVTTGSASTFAVHFNDANNGLTGGTAMLKTVDGGTTWTATTIPGASGSLDGISGIGTDYWAIRTGTDVYRTTNQGGTWTTAYTVTGAAFNDIDIISGTGGCPTGWAVGTGTIVRLGTTVGITSYSSEIPESYLLKQNFPNPFNPTTNINFTIPSSGFVTLKVYNMAGMEVASLINETKTAGSYVVGFNAANLPSGAYFYRLETNNFTDTKKMLLIK